MSTVNSKRPLASPNSEPLDKRQKVSTTNPYLERRESPIKHQNGIRPEGRSLTASVPAERVVPLAASSVGRQCADGSPKNLDPRRRTLKSPVVRIDKSNKSDMMVNDTRQPYSKHHAMHSHSPGEQAQRTQETTSQSQSCEPKERITKTFALLQKIIDLNGKACFTRFGSLASLQQRKHEHAEMANKFAGKVPSAEREARDNVVKIEQEIIAMQQQLSSWKLESAQATNDLIEICTECFVAHSKHEAANQGEKQNELFIEASTARVREHLSSMLNTQLVELNRKQSTHAQGLTEISKRQEIHDKELKRLFDRSSECRADLDKQADFHKFNSERFAYFTQMEERCNARLEAMEKANESKFKAIELENADCKAEIEDLRQALADSRSEIADRSVQEKESEEMQARLAEQANIIKKQQLMQEQQVTSTSEHLEILTWISQGHAELEKRNDNFEQEVEKLKADTNTAISGTDILCTTCTGQSTQGHPSGLLAPDGEVPLHVLSQIRSQIKPECKKMIETTIRDFDSALQTRIKKLVVEHFLRVLPDAMRDSLPVLLPSMTEKLSAIVSHFKKEMECRLQDLEARPQLDATSIQVKAITQGLPEDEGTVGMDSHVASVQTEERISQSDIHRLSDDIRAFVQQQFEQLAKFFEERLQESLTISDGHRLQLESMQAQNASILPILEEIQQQVNRTCLQVKKHEEESEASRHAISNIEARMNNVTTAEMADLIFRSVKKHYPPADLPVVKKHIEHLHKELQASLSTSERQRQAMIDMEQISRQRYQELENKFATTQSIVAAGMQPAKSIHPDLIRRLTALEHGQQDVRLALGASPSNYKVVDLNEKLNRHDDDLQLLRIQCKQLCDIVKPLFTNSVQDSINCIESDLTKLAWSPDRTSSALPPQLRVSLEATCDRARARSDVTPTQQPENSALGQPHLENSSSSQRDRLNIHATYLLQIFKNLHEVNCQLKGLSTTKEGFTKTLDHEILNQEIKHTHTRNTMKESAMVNTNVMASSNEATKSVEYCQDVVRLIGDLVSKCAKSLCDGRIAGIELVSRLVFELSDVLQGDAAALNLPQTITNEAHKSLTPATPEVPETKLGNICRVDERKRSNIPGQSTVLASYSLSINSSDNTDPVRRPETMNASSTTLIPQGNVLQSRMPTESAQIERTREDSKASGTFCRNGESSSGLSLVSMSTTGNNDDPIVLD